MKACYLLTLLIFFSTSCSRTTLIPTNSTSGEELHEEANVTVDLSQESEYMNQVKVDETLNNSDVFGPKIEGAPSEIVKSKTNVNGLFIGPVAYESFSSLQAIQSLQMKGVRFHLYSGSGLGLIFATFLAAGKSVDQIEWFFFKIKKDLNEYKIYSDEWSDYLIDQVLSFIQIERIEDLSGSLVVPLYHNTTKRIHYFTRGKIKNYLKSNFSLYSNSKYTSAINKNLFPTYGLRSAHSDTIICIDSLGEKLKFKDIDHYLLGLLNRLKSIRGNERKNCDQMLSINANIEIDDITALDRFRVEDRKQIDSQANYIAEIIKK